MMKNRRLIVFLLLAVVVSAMAVLLKYRHTVFHTQKENMFIEHYEGNSGIVPSFISNMRINDTLGIDATILQAADSASWCLLCTEFKVKDLDSTDVEKIKNGKEDFYNVTKKLVTILEHEIIRNPEMWFWTHDRWKDGRRRFGGKKK